MTGLWWKNTNRKPPVTKGLFSTWIGSRHLPPKRWWNFWRWRQEWHLFEVDIPEGSGAYYQVCFQSDGKTMTTRRWFNTKFFFARVGAHPVTFWAFSEGRHHAEPLPIKRHGPGEIDMKDPALLEVWHFDTGFFTRRGLMRTGEAVSV